MQDSDNNRYEIHFAKVKYDNPYWISFNLTNKEIKSYDNDIKVEEMVYELPENIVDEWETVLNKHK